MNNDELNKAAEQSDLHDPLAQLLAKAGPRRSPPPALTAEVRAAVHAEWQHLVKARRAKQQRHWLAIAASLIGVIGIGWLVRNLNDQPTPSNTAVLATITQSQGSATLNSNAAASNEAIHGGDVLRTQPNAGLRIELASGVSLRVATASELHWLNAREVRLDQGSLYVDSHTNAAPLTVHTVRGDVTHVGTRYLVDMDAQMLHVAVREGQVAIHSGAVQMTVNALEQVQVDANAKISRSSLALDDGVWQWADTLAQPFVLENRSVADFLQWVSSETGYQVSYANKQIRDAANRTLLHGSQTNRPPLQALQTVLTATDFHADVQGKQLVITQGQ